MIHVIIHLSKSIQCKTPRVNPKVNCGPLGDDVPTQVHCKCTPLGCWQWGRLRGGGGRESMETRCSPLNFTVNLKLLFLDRLFQNKKLVDTKFDIWLSCFFVLPGLKYNHQKGQVTDHDKGTRSDCYIQTPLPKPEDDKVQDGHPCAGRTMVSAHCRQRQKRLCDQPQWGFSPQLLGENSWH